MADFVFNISKGRVGEFYNRVKNNDPANSVFVIIALSATGIEADSVLRDVDTFAALVAGTTDEVNNTGYARKVLTDANLAAWTPDDTNDRADYDIPDQTWTGVLATPNWSKLVIGYLADSTAGTGAANNANIIPMTAHDFAVTPDGSDITAQVATAGFYRAS